MKPAFRPTRILLCQSVGFLAIIAVCFFDELVRLSSLVFGDDPCIVDFRDSALKMLLILGVWLMVGGSTRRILAEAQHLAGFMKVCAWCRRIEHKNRWMPLEEFLKLGFDTTTSHGICQECLQKANAALEQAKQEKIEPGATGNCNLPCSSFHPGPSERAGVLGG